MGIMNHLFRKKVNPDKQKFDQAYYLTFIGIIPEYFVDESGSLKGLPETWQATLLSYSFYIGLGGSLFEKKLAENLNSGAKQFENTSNLVMIGFNTIDETNHIDVGDLWAHSINYINNFMSLSSAETAGPNANMKLVKDRAPISGFTPGLIIGIKNPEFAKRLLEDAVTEKKYCDTEELIARIKYMKDITDEVMERLLKTRTGG